MFFKLCLEFLPYSMEVRRAVLISEDVTDPKMTNIALSVFRGPSNIRKALWNLARLTGRYVTVSLVPCTFLPHAQRLRLGQ